MLDFYVGENDHISGVLCLGLSSLDTVSSCSRFDFFIAFIPTDIVFNTQGHIGYDYTVVAGIGVVIAMIKIRGFHWLYLRPTLRFSSEFIYYPPYGCFFGPDRIVRAADVKSVSNNHNPPRSEYV